MKTSMVPQPVTPGRSLSGCADAMLCYLRKDVSGKFVYLFALGKQHNEMMFDSHGQAFDWAVEHQLDFVHQPWTRELDDRIRGLLETNFKGES